MDSVAGVLIRASVVIPLLTNYRALLLLSALLCIATAVATRFLPRMHFV